ncbi:unnamed protein product [Caenorhabditis nigoni]
MNEADIKEEVIEETCNFTFINGEYVEVKQEEIEQKPENLLEQEIKTEPIEFFEKNNSDEFCEDIKLEPKESDSKIEKHGKLRFASTSSGKLLRSFIAKNKHLIKTRTSKKRICQVCHMAKWSSQLFSTCSKEFRMVMMVGSILRRTHSVEQAKDYITNHRGDTCYSHRKETIDKIFEHLGVLNILEFFKCPKFAMSDLVDIAKNFDSDFTVDQFSRAIYLLYMRNPKKVPISL